MQNPRPDPDQRQHLISSRGSALAYAYHVWLTSVNAFVSYPAHTQNEFNAFVSYPAHTQNE